MSLHWRRVCAEWSERWADLALQQLGRRLTRHGTADANNEATTMQDEIEAGDPLIRQAEEGRKAFGPEVTLFVSDSLESKQAQAVLETSEEPFRTIRSSDPRTPVAIFGFSAYEKLSGIEALVAELHAFDADVQSAYEKRFRTSQPFPVGNASSDRTLGEKAAPLMSGLREGLAGKFRRH